MFEYEKNMRRRKKYTGVRTILLFSFVILGIILLFTGTAIADGDDDHMEDGHMMDMDWWGMPFMGFWMIGLWLVFLVIAFLVYKDAEERGMSGLLWFILVILPWIGILFLVIYLIIRKDKVVDRPLQKSANAIIDERYARGEITREDYQRMKKDIRS